MMAKDTLGAAKEFSQRLEKEEILLFEKGTSQNLARSLVELAFVEGATWALDRIHEEAQG